MCSAKSRSRRPSTKRARYARLANEKKLATQMGNQGSGRKRIAHARSKSFRLASSASRWSCTSGPIVRFGRKVSAGPRAKIRSPNVGLGFWLGPAQTTVQERHLSHVQMARLARFRHRRSGRHGLSHGQYAFPRAQARLPKCRRMRVASRIYPETSPKPRASVLSSPNGKACRRSNSGGMTATQRDALKPLRPGRERH